MAGDGGHGGALRDYRVEPPGRYSAANSERIVHVRLFAGGADFERYATTSYSLPSFAGGIRRVPLSIEGRGPAARPRPRQSEYLLRLYADTRRLGEGEEQGGSVRHTAHRNAAARSLEAH